MGKTNAVRLIELKSIPHTTLSYDYEEAHIDAVSVARTLCVDPDQVFKTLVASSHSGETLVFCIPGSAELDLKKAARASGTKQIRMVRAAELEKLTGYTRGGCSPIGMKKLLPTYLDESAELWDRILVSGGRRGLQIEIAPVDLIDVAHAAVADLTA